MKPPPRLHGGPGGSRTGAEREALPFWAAGHHGEPLGSAQGTGIAARPARQLVAVPLPSATCPSQSAIFDFTSMLTVVLLFICTMAFLRPRISWISAHRTGFEGIPWKLARIGERASPAVAVGCIAMAVYILFIV